jgi:hypothetical protein
MRKNNKFKKSRSGSSIPNELHEILRMKNKLSVSNEFDKILLEKLFGSSSNREPLGPLAGKPSSSPNS